MTGALIQLAAKGHGNITLTENPEFTYFKLNYKKYTNFSILQTKNYFENNVPEFGKHNVEVKLSNKGDYITNLFFHTTIKSSTTNNLGKWSYTSNIGFSLIEKVELVIDQILVDKIYGVWLCVWKEIYNTSEKKKLIDKLIGHTEEALSYNNKSKNLDLIIPLPFFTSYNLALPIYNLQNNNLSLFFYFKEKKQLINKQQYYFNENNSVNNNPDITNQTYEIDLELSNCFILSDNILIDPEVSYILEENVNLIIEKHEYQEFIIDSNVSKFKKEIFLSHPNKYFISILQPGGLLNGSKYLATPGKNFFLNAAKRFCLRYCATGWVGNNDYLLPYNKYGIFQNDSGENINGIGYNIVFDHGLTSLKSKGKMTDQENIIYNLFYKLNPIIIKYYGNTLISAKIDNIKVNINNLTEQDKYILSLPTNKLDDFIKDGGNNFDISTGDNNNEGNSKYDINIYDTSIYSNYLDGTKNLIKTLKFSINNSDIVKEFDSNLFDKVFPYKFNLNINLKPINFYSYCINPLDINPSGTLNFSRINNSIIYIDLDVNSDKISNLVYKLENQIIQNNSKLIFMSKYFNILNINNNKYMLKFT